MRGQTPRAQILNIILYNYQFFLWGSWSVDCGCSVQVLCVYVKNFLGSVRVAVLLGVDCLESPNMGLSLTGLRSGCLCVLKLCKHAELCSALYNMYWFFFFLSRKPRVFLFLCWYKGWSVPQDHSWGTSRARSLLLNTSKFSRSPLSITQSHQEHHFILKPLLSNRSACLSGRPSDH